jgi:hypothetical protein
MAERKYKMTGPEVLGSWAVDYPKVTAWLSKLQKKERNAWNLWLYCDMVGKNPDELLALKDEPRSREAEFLLDNFAANESARLPNSVLCNVVNSVKSFYTHNYADLAKACARIEQLKLKPYRKHSKDEMLKVYRACQNPRDRALITFTWSTAVARETLTKMQWRHLEPDWQTQEFPHLSLPDKLLKGHGLGRYRNVEQHTFLTPEAKRDLIDYKDWLERVKLLKLTADSAVFMELHAPYKAIGYTSMSKIATVLSRRSGVPFSWHDARRYVETALEETKINPNWARKIRGRKVKGEEAPYSRPAVEQLRKAYSEAVPLLEFTQQTQLVELQKRQAEIEEIVSGLTAEQKEKMEKYGLRIEKRLGSMLKKRLSRRPKKLRTATNGGDCSERFEQINETQLLAYLESGWKLVHRLASGEVIVKR